MVHLVLPVFGNPVQMMGSNSWPSVGTGGGGMRRIEIDTRSFFGMAWVDQVTVCVSPGCQNSFSAGDVMVIWGNAWRGWVWCHRAPIVSNATSAKTNENDQRSLLITSIIESLCQIGEVGKDVTFVRF